MPVTLRNTDGSELDLDNLTGHSSAMWEAGDIRIPYSDIAGATELIMGANERASLLLEAKDDWQRRALAERERCAKIAESPVGCGEIVTVESGDLKGFSEGMRYACAEIASKIREGV